MLFYRASDFLYFCECDVLIIGVGVVAVIIILKKNRIIGKKD